MFVARISKGRTIRQFVIYVVLVPSLVSFVWFAILGGTAINLQLNEGWSPPTTETGGIALEGALFDTLREFPLATITVALAVFLVAIFFVTGADAASIVMGMLSQNGTEEPNRILVSSGVSPPARSRRCCCGPADCRRCRPCASWSPGRSC